MKEGQGDPNKWKGTGLEQEIFDEYTMPTKAYDGRAKPPPRGQKTYTVPMTGIQAEIPDLGSLDQL